VATLLFSLLFFKATQQKIATSKHYGMNDIKEKEQLPIVPLAILLLSGESGQTDGRTETFSIYIAAFSAGYNKLGT
jgi:hypothetical protein